VISVGWGGGGGGGVKFLVLKNVQRPFGAPRPAACRREVRTLHRVR